MNKLSIIHINPSQLRPNPWNSNVVTPENEEKLRESLTRFGVFKPILIRTLQDGGYQILGGQHRALVAKKMGLGEVPVINLGQMDDKRAKEIGLLDNGRYGQDNTLQLAEVLESIGDIEDIASYMPFTEQDLNQIFASVDIEFEDLDLDEPTDKNEMPKEAAPQTHMLMRFKVPIGDASEVQAVIESIMKHQGFNKEDSLSNAGHALVWLIKNTED